MRWPIAAAGASVVLLLVSLALEVSESMAVGPGASTVSPREKSVRIERSARPRWMKPERPRLPELPGLPEAAAQASDIGIGGDALVIRVSDRAGQLQPDLGIAIFAPGSDPESDEPLVRRYTNDRGMVVVPHGIDRRARVRAELDADTLADVVLEELPSAASDDPAVRELVLRARVRECQLVDPKGAPLDFSSFSKMWTYENTLGLSGGGGGSRNTLKIAWPDDEDLLEVAVTLRTADGRSGTATLTAAEQECTMVAAPSDEVLAIWATH